METLALRASELHNLCREVLDADRVKFRQIQVIDERLGELTRKVGAYLETLKSLYERYLQDIPAESVKSYGTISRVEDILIEEGLISKRTL